MEQQEVFSKVVEIITPFSKNEEALKSVSNDTNILKDLGVNSARLVDIILAFEDHFDIEVDDDSADKVQTIGNAVELIAAKLSA
ncbi:acyl carrier protein [bacterium]|nr:acyl carrier protein [bacterium]MBU1919004.1 acyl carrier protein [bacterium]